MKKMKQINFARKKGSLLLEYTFFIAVIVAALIGMQIYVKRAVCGRWRQSADVFGSGRQYEPGVTEIK